MYDTILTEIDPLFLKDLTFKNIIKEKEIIKEIKKEKEYKFFTPYEKDKLFWCFYIFKNGLADYEIMENKNIVKEKEEKIKYIEKIRKNKSILKQHKIKLLPNIESNLLNDDVIDLRTFHVLCILENINYLFIDKQFYYEKIIDEENKLFVLHKINNSYCYEINNKNNYKEHKLQKIDIDKNFLCISHYTLKELKDICEKLQIVIQPTWKKKDIYDFLLHINQ